MCLRGCGNRVMCYLQRRLAMLAAGFMSVAFVAAAMSGIMGEFPVKWVMVLVTSAGWGAFVALVRREWSWRAIEDFVFLAVYGAIPAVVLFDEIEPGNSTLTVDLSIAAPVYVIISAHLAVGVLSRLFSGDPNAGK